MLLLLTALACQKPTPLPDMAPMERPVVITEDGWELELRHYPGEGPPVLLAHGMGANHYNFDYKARFSLADYLQREGWDVWVPAMRGGEGSKAPSPEAGENFGYDEHALFDMPAVIDGVLELSGEDQLYWVGHSMGGMLLYTQLGAGEQRIAAAVTLAAPATMETQLRPHRLARMGAVFVPERGLFHNQVVYRALRPLGAANPMAKALLVEENVDWETIEELSVIALEDMARGKAKDVQRWLRTGVISDDAGEPWLAPADTPVLVLAGSADRVAPPANVAAACEVLTDCTFRELGASTGYDTDYGHVDLVLGLRSRDEVYPMVGDFLREQLPPEVVLVPREEHDPVSEL